MNRPEKRKLEKGSAYLQYDKGYNHSHGDWERFLPSEEEVYNLITTEWLKIGLLTKTSKKYYKQLAKKISKRL